MTAYMYDAAYAPDLVKVKAAGGVAINGYISGVYASTTTQPAAAHAAGLGWVATYEEGRSELVHATRAQGQAIGRKILAALQAKGVPLDGSCAVYPSVDVPVSVADPQACNEAWRGMKDVLGNKVSLRAYAEGAIIDTLVKFGLVDGKCWLAAPTSWPGYNVNDANVCVIQLVGTPVGGTDQNHIVTDPSALGAWWPDTAPTNIVEAIMALPGAPADYKTFLADMQNIVNKPLWQTAAGPHSPDTVIRLAVGSHVDKPLAELVQLVGALPTRLAALQAAVAALSPVTVDAPAIAQAVMDKIKAAFSA